MDDSPEKRYITRSYRYDPLDRLVSQSDGSSVTEEFAYDMSGNLVARNAPASGSSDGARIAPEETMGKQTASRAFCPDCGAALKPGVAFCAQCGKKLF